ncbi:related to SD08430p [Lecanosticta acicola]|uniref:Related to SD08430p n=1 Tax=Lecanosticta acicola TaxID=111012 RepID=A0AAI8W1N7_9PEZI|nr:related to SD08430p [Lecanosticta acicola]
MGDSTTSRLSLIAAGSAQFNPSPPVHEARAREEREHTQADRLESGIGDLELDNIQPGGRGKGRLSERLDRLEHPNLYDHLTEDDEDDEGDDEQMPNRKSKSRSPNPRGGSLRSSTRRKIGSLSTSSSISELANGYTGDADMNGTILEARQRKHASLEIPGEDSAEAAERLMGRSTFSLDHPPPETPSKNEGGQESKGFFELPKQDQRNFLLLVLLYFLQGIPMGLAGGSVPFLLKSHLSYAQIGVYSLASYPYSLKLLWSPIVDAVWSTKVGRRKSWILPIQMLSGFGMIWLGTKAEQMMVQAGENGGAGIWGFTGWWFALVFMCATQDIAVDGWALTLLSQSNLSYASTAQTVGLTGGQFLSYTVFLALSSPDFANAYFRSTPEDVGLMTLNSYLTFWGWFYLVVTLGLAILKKEERTKEREGIWDVYKIMGGILKLKNIQIFIIIHLIAKIGFQANDAVTNLKLLDKGFSQEDLALTVLIDFPFEMGLGYYAGKWSEQYQPIRVWCWAFVGRLAAAVVAQLVVMFFPASGTNLPYLLLIIVTNVYSTFTNTVMFVAISAFHAKISDPAIGGTYMTLLATVSNLGGTFPRFFILRFVDAFSKATCIPPTTPPADLKGDLITQAFSCVAEAEKHRCVNGGGTCDIQRDGYYIVNILCVAFGLITFYGFIKPQALKLQALPMRAWRLASGS